MDSGLEREDRRGRSAVSEAASRGDGSEGSGEQSVHGSPRQERYHDYILRRMKEEDAKEKLSDQAMISKLRTMAHWTTKEPWTQIADRLEELVRKE
jgi:hypothetical protein